MKNHLIINCSKDELKFIQENLSTRERAGVLLAGISAKICLAAVHPDVMKSFLAMSEEQSETYEGDYNESE